MILMRYQITTQSGVREYNPDRNYNVNDVVSIGSTIFQNVTGIQGNPQTDTVNWLKVSSDAVGGTITDASCTFSDLSAVNGYISSIAANKNIIICVLGPRVLLENRDFLYNVLNGDVELIGDFKDDVIANSADYSPMTLNFKIQ